MERAKGKTFWITSAYCAEHNARGGYDGYCVIVTHPDVRRNKCGCLRRGYPCLFSLCTTTFYDYFRPLKQGEVVEMRLVEVKKENEHDAE